VCEGAWQESLSCGVFLIFKGQLVDGLPPSSAPPHPAAEVSVAIPVIGLTLQWRVEGKVKLLT
jgi:hypothetical protein